MSDASRPSPPPGLRLAVTVLPAERGDPARALRSVGDARAVGEGDFVHVEAFDPELGEAHDSLAAAAARAQREGFDVLLAINSDETLAPDAFVKLQPPLRLHEAVWGGAALATGDGSAPKLERITRLAAQTLPAFFHAAFRWWIGRTHFVRPKAAIEALSPASNGLVGYMERLWRRGAAYKTAQCLTHIHGPLRELAEADRAALIASLEADPVFMPVYFGGRRLELPYTGLNPVIEREQMRGLFFEQEELAFLAERLPAGLRIVDVGANTGNHTLFFAGILQAENVQPIEPLPRAAAALRAMVERNALTNVDLSQLGIAVGAGHGRLRAAAPTTAGLGATHFVVDAGGDTPLAPLDALVRDRVDFVKIDAEGMEMQVLAGAAELVAAQHPLLFIEVVDEMVGPFMRWVDQTGYRVERVFPDKTHCNYFLMPRGRLQR